MHCITNKTEFLPKSRNSTLNSRLLSHQTSDSILKIKATIILVFQVSKAPPTSFVVTFSLDLGFVDFASLSLNDDAEDTCIKMTLVYCQMN